jgi:hypothetical protein
VEQFPEFIGIPGEVMAGFGGTGPWIEADKDDGEAGGEDIADFFHSFSLSHIFQGASYSIK